MPAINELLAQIQQTFLQDLMRFENYAGSQINFSDIPKPRAQRKGFHYKAATAGDK